MAEIDVNYVKFFTSVIHVLAYQRPSNLSATVMRQNVVGEAWSKEILGGSPRIFQMNTRNEPLPDQQLDHNRRWGYVQTYYTVGFLNQLEQIFMLADFKNEYTRRFADLIRLEIDRTIVNTLDAPVQEGKNGETTVPFPASQTIYSVDSSNNPVPLNLRTLLRAKEKLMADNVAASPDDPVYLLLSPNTWLSLLEDIRLTSLDYTRYAALESGRIPPVMGFQPIITNLVPDAQDVSYNGGAAVNKVFVYLPDALVLGMAKEPTTVISQRPDRVGIPWQIYIEGAWGATRLEDKRVVRILAAKI